MDKVCYIHAGTHKTASTYIQSRLIRNQRLLARQGIIYRYPEDNGLRHKPLAKAAQLGRWNYWNQYLDDLDRDNSNLLISAEQFCRLLCERKKLKKISSLLLARGYRLHALVFIRPQLDYMNSMYTYTLRRFYHDTPFPDYIHKHLSPDSPGIYDYNRLFKPLLKSSAASTFLPFSRSYGDPFMQLIQAIGLDPTKSYRSAASGTENVQAGTKGVWLSRLVFQRLQALGFNGKMLQNAAKVVVKVARQKGWLQDRYYGFSEELATCTLDYFREGNDQFSRKVWSKPWDEVFAPAPLPRQSVYSPATPAEVDQMNHLADKCIRKLAAKNPPLAKSIKFSANP